MDVYLVSLPGFLLTTISALPLIIGLIAAVRSLRQELRPKYLQNLVACTVAGIVALTLLWDTLFSDDLSKSSTSALIFAVTPIYAAGALGIVYGIFSTLFKNSEQKIISPYERYSLIAPILLLIVLMYGLLITSIHGSDLTIANKAWNQETLHKIFEKSKDGKSNKFGIQLFLSQNPNTPSEILLEIAHYDSYLKGFVAQHPNTPSSYLLQLSEECALSARTQEIVNKRLIAEKALRTNAKGCAYKQE